MKTPFFILFVILNSLCFGSCRKTEVQNFDFIVSGNVTDENNIGIPDVIIGIERGKANLFNTSYENYDTVITNASGDYSYTVKKEAGYIYKLCCGTIPGYYVVGEVCKHANDQIIDGKSLPVTINFSLAQ